MQYYRISQSAASGGTAATDADERIARDAQMVATEMSLALCESIYAGTAGSFFAWKLARIYGVRFAAGPFVYLWFMFALTSRIAPVRWGALTGKLRNLSSRLYEQHSRVKQNAEAVAALGGGRVELDILRHRLSQVLTATHGFNTAVIWPGWYGCCVLHNRKVIR